MRRQPWLAAALAACSMVLASTVGLVGGASADDTGGVSIVVYDSFEAAGGYTLLDYASKWSNPYGIGEMTLGDTRKFDNDTFFVGATPFRTGFDASVLDHIKYFARSTETFPVPETGSVSFAATIDAQTPGTQPGREVTGRYLPSTSHPLGRPYSAPVMEAQQAAATLHMIDFSTGQLFDWLVSGSTAITLTERLPSSVTGSVDHGYVGRDKMYTQIIREVPVSPGPHTYEIRYTRTAGGTAVKFLLDGNVVSEISRVGVPLDVQGVEYTGVYPSLGPGEDLRDELDSVSIGHGLFSLLDAFPFQHPEVPEAWVSIPLTQRLFGQGARAHFDDFVVTTVHTGEE